MFYTYFAMKNFFKRLLAGMGIGAGAAIPGVSGAAIALILHVYEDIINAVNSFRKKFGWAIRVLIPILLGIMIAVVICVIVFHLAFEYCMFVLICAFAGFLIGSFPGITDNVKEVKISKKHIISAIIGAIFVITLGVLSVVLGSKGSAISTAFIEMPIWLYFVLIPVGAVAAVALTVPGLSGSLILLIIGFYRPLMDNAVLWGKEIVGVGTEQTWAHFPQLIGMIGCFGVGCLIGVVLISKLMTLLLKKYHDVTYYAIIGFVLGSVFVLFFNYDIFNYYLYWGGQVIEGVKINPIMPIYVEIPVGIVVLAIAAFLSYQLVRYNRKNQIEQADEPLE